MNCASLGTGVASGSGSMTVKTAPGPSLTVIVPPCRCVSRWTRASPSPRRAVPRSGRVDQPSSKIDSAAPDGIPGPLSATRTITKSTASISESSTSRPPVGGGPSAAASIALSSRLPTMVSSRRRCGGSSPSAESSLSTIRTPRSAATVVLATISPTSSAFPIRSRTDSVNAWSAPADSTAYS